MSDENYDYLSAIKADVNGIGEHLLSMAKKINETRVHEDEMDCMTAFGEFVCCALKEISISIGIKAMPNDPYRDKNRVAFQEAYEPVEDLVEYFTDEIFEGGDDISVFNKIIKELSEQKAKK